MELAIIDHMLIASTITLVGLVVAWFVVPDKYWARLA